MSPFCRNFNFIRDLCDTFIRYCPNNFTYEGVVGGELPYPTINLEVDCSDVITSYHVSDKISCIENDNISSGSAMDDDEEDIDGDGDGVGVDVDTVPLTEPSFSNA